MRTLSRSANAIRVPRMALATWFAHQAGHQPKLRVAIQPFRRLALTPAPKTRTIRLGEVEQVPKNVLSQIEQMIVKDGLDETVLRIAPQFPRLTELLTEKTALMQFLEYEEVPEKWRKALHAFAKCPNNELRAVGTVVYLRKAHRHSTKK